MKTFISHLRAPLLCCAFVLCTLIAACGGAGISIAMGGVGSGGSGVAEGAVSGFGSVIVAGVEYDDTNANVVTENASGQRNLTEVKLGQRVRILQSKASVADSIQVLPQLMGPASSAQDGHGTFQILGQTVQIIASSDAQNTATVLDGLTNVSAGDELEVHGNWVFDNTRNYAILIATRIEKLSTVTDPVLVSGVIRTRNNTVITFDNAGGQTLQYSNLPSTLGAQNLISAWIPRTALNSSPWLATRVVDASPSLADNDHLVLNTQITDRDLAQGEIRVQGLRVKLTDSFSATAPTVGSTVQIEIVRAGNDYKTVALTKRQNTNELGGSVELKGSLLWPSNPAQLNLRGNLVNVPSAALGNNCASLNTNDSVYLEISAQRVGSGQPLLATRVACNPQIPNGSVIEVSGTLTQLNTSTKTIQVSTNKGLITLIWNSATLQPSNLNNLLNNRVEIEYQSINGENRLRKIKPD